MRGLRERLLAFAGLTRRYRRAFAHAWQHRHDRDSRPYLPYEAQFLPAALSLQESPVSPAPRRVMWALILIAVLALVWAVFGKIDVVATAHGKIVPNARTKVIQPLEAGSIESIHVRDGQVVKAGDVLIVLDATVAYAERARITQELSAARIQAARSRALLSAIETARPPRLVALSEADRAALDEAQRLLEGQFAEFQSKSARLNADVARREAELQSVRESSYKVERTLPIARQRAADFKALLDKQFISTHMYLEREQAVIEQEADQSILRSRQQEAQAALKEVRQQQQALVAEVRRNALDTLNEATQRAASLDQERVKAQSRAGLMSLKAPVDGTVQQLAVHTLGGVVTTAQPLMVIVPHDDTLEIEAFLENKDVGFVSPEQDAEVKVETFPYTKYGTLPARIAHVSGDAISDEKFGLIYAVRAKLAKTSIQLENRAVNLTAGMAVTVEIKTGKRRVIEYFLSPLLQYGTESLRER
jgi:hemolysin D